MLYKFTRENDGVYAYNVPSEHYFRNQKKKKKNSIEKHGAKKKSYSLAFTAMMSCWCSAGNVKGGHFKNDVKCGWARRQRVRWRIFARGIIKNVFYFTTRRQDFRVVQISN